MPTIKIDYATGRFYGSAQILAIRADVPQEADPFDDVTVTFEDRARGIAGRVSLFVIEADAGYIGAAVLREYDAGRYIAC